MTSITNISTVPPSDKAATVWGTARQEVEIIKSIKDVTMVLTTMHTEDIKRILTQQAAPIVFSYPVAAFYLSTGSTYHYTGNTTTGKNNEVGWKSSRIFRYS